MSDFNELDSILKEANDGFHTVLTEKEVNSIRDHQKVYEAVIKGQFLRRQKERELKEQNSCNHRKGGYAQYITGKGYTGKIGLGSAANDYAVIKHTFPWGDQWVRCLRCGKWWKPGDSDYQEALLFPTTNISSSAITFQLDSISLERARESTRGT